MKNLKFIFLVALFTLTTLSSVVVAQGNLNSGYSVPDQKEDISQVSSSELWDRANTAYANDNYNVAESLYAEILGRDLHSVDLYYNMGNVKYKRGKIGESLLYYYKALKLKPSDEDIKHNIEVVSLSVQDNITQIPRLFFLEWDRQIGSSLNCMTWSVLSLISFLLMLAALMYYLLSKKMVLRRGGFIVTLVAVVIFCTTTRYALDARSDIVNPDEAIIMNSSVSVTSAPSRSSTELFILHEGTKVRIDNSVDGWHEIVLDDGKKGWVTSSAIELI